MGPKKYDKAFSKTIALALALLLASSTLTGCDLFRPRQEEASNQEIELEAPEPDEDNLGADLMDDSEVEADVDPDIEDTEQPALLQQQKIKVPQVQAPLRKISL